MSDVQRLAPAPPRPPQAVRRPPLDGIRVADFSRIFAGPLCSMTLGDLGADVVKIEPPGGDEARGFGPPWLGGEGMNFMALNRNKRSIALDLKSAGGREAALRLAAEADIVIENFRPGVAERLGIGWEELSAANPGLLYCSISGFGRRGPNSARPALDLVLQGASGVLDRQGRGGPPQMVVITIADCYAAALAVQALLAALIARSRDGIGQRVEVTLYEAMLAAQAYRIVSPAGDEPQLPAASDIAPYGAFETVDGWITLAIVTDRSWDAFCRSLDLDELGADARLATNAGRVEHQDEVVARVASALRGQSTRELLGTLEAAGVPCGPVTRVEDLFFDEHVLENEIIVELEHPSAGRMWTLGVPFAMAGTPLSIRRPAPRLGEHSREVLAELGYDEGHIDRVLRETAPVGDLEGA